MFSFTKQEQLVLGVLAGTFAAGLGWNGWQRHQATRTLAAYEATYQVFDRRVDSLARGPGDAGTPDTAAAMDAAPVAQNINTIGRVALEALPRIGPVLAGRILSLRATVGPFDSLEQLLMVRGIGPRTLENIRPFLTVEPPPHGAPR